MKISKRRGRKPMKSKDDRDVVDDNGLGRRRECLEIDSPGVNN